MTERLMLVTGTYGGAIFHFVKMFNFPATLSA